MELAGSNGRPTGWAKAPALPDWSFSQPERLQGLCSSKKNIYAPLFCKVLESSFTDGRATLEGPGKPRSWRGDFFGGGEIGGDDDIPASESRADARFSALPGAPLSTRGLKLTSLEKPSINSLFESERTDWVRWTLRAVWAPWVWGARVTGTRSTKPVHHQGIFIRKPCKVGKGPLLPSNCDPERSLLSFLSVCVVKSIGSKSGRTQSRVNML